MHNPKPRHVDALPEDLLITDPLKPDELVDHRPAKQWLTSELNRMLSHGCHVELLENGGGRLAIARTPP